ncbi:MAG: chemotaxis protein CheW [Chloroflexi bacterium]|nr:chemotaxis protein CheW [Chloroflexota bacterium]
MRDHILPLVGLSQVYGFTNGKANGATHRYVVAVKWGKLEVGLMVDKLLGNQEVVIKSLGVLVGETPGVSGAAILGDGRVALIVDVPGLFKMIGA